MASHFTLLDLALWITGFTAEILLFLFLSKKSIYRRFPIFFSFVGFGLVRELLLFYVAYRMSIAAYFYAFWAAAILEYLIQFAVLYELMKALFGPLEILPKQTLELFLVGCIAITIILAAVGFLFPATEFGPIFTMIVYLQHGSEFLRGAVLLLLLPFVSVLGLRWTNYALGIVLGIGSVATVTLVCSAVGVTLGRNLGVAGLSFTQYIPNIAQIVSFLIWIDYFRKPEPAREQVSVEVLNGLKGVSNQLEDLYTSPVGMVRRLMWHSS